MKWQPFTQCTIGKMKKTTVTISLLVCISLIAFNESMHNEL